MTGIPSLIPSQIISDENPSLISDGLCPIANSVAKLCISCSAIKIQLIGFRYCCTPPSLSLRDLAERGLSDRGPFGEMVAKVFSRLLSSSLREVLEEASLARSLF